MKSALVRIFQKNMIRPALVPFYTHLFKLSLRGMGILNSEGSEITGEKWLMELVKKQRLPANVIVDVGANTGGYAAELFEYFPKAAFYCFEPNPETFARLQQNHRRHSGFHCYNQAVSSKNGEFILYDFADNAPLKPTQPTATMASAYKEVIEQFHHQPAKEYRLKSVCLDSWAEANSITHIDWLKIDTEGHELEVLKGARTLLSKHRISMIQFEFNDMHAYSRALFRDFIDILNGYTLYRLLPNGWFRLADYRPLTFELFGFQNIVAVENSQKLL